MSSPSTSRRRARLSRVVRAVSVVTSLGLAPSALLAESKTWVGEDGDWNDDAGWISFGRPRNGDSAFLANASGPPITLTYADGDVSLGELAFAGGSGITLFQTGGSLTSVNEGLGAAGFPVFSVHRQEGGFNRVTGTLTVGDPFNPNASGRYELVDGFLNANVVQVLPNGALGVGGGRSRFQFNTINQSGGVLNAFLLEVETGSTYNMNGGSFDGRMLVSGGAVNHTAGVSTQFEEALTIFSGTYDLGGGELRTAVSEIDARSSNNFAQFTQTGGIHHISQTFAITGHDNLAIYHLRGGELLAPTVTVGGAVGGINNSSFVHNGGTHTIGNRLDLFNRGTYNLLNGSLNANVIAIANQGFLNQSGGTLNATQIVIGPGAVFNYQSGTLNAATFVNVGEVRLRGGDAHINGRLTNDRGATITARDGRVLVLGEATNDGEITTTNGTILFNAGVKGTPGGIGELRGTIVLGGGGNLIASTVRQSLLALDGTPAAPASATILPTSAGGGGVVVVDSLRIAGDEDEWHGRLDLADTDLLIRTTASTRDAVRATIESQVAAARNATAGRWLGNGITSSAAAADRLTTLAVGLLADEVLVRHSYNGDANLDGRINADDFFQIDSGFLASPQDPLFVQGDFNYDDRINADDYFLIDSAFLAQGAPLASATASTATLSAAAVPEPAMTLLGLYGACVLLKRRRPLRSSSCGNLLKVAAVAAAG